MNYMYAMLLTDETLTHDTQTYMTFVCILNQLKWNDYWYDILQIPLLLSALINNHMPSTVWDEITYQFPNFKHLTNWCIILSHTLYWM